MVASGDGRGGRLSKQPGVIMTLVLKLITILPTTAFLVGENTSGRISLPNSVHSVSNLPHLH